jgi:hypothetical protein
MGSAQHEGRSAEVEHFLSFPCFNVRSILVFTFTYFGAVASGVAFDCAPPHLGHQVAVILIEERGAIFAFCLSFGYESQSSVGI